MKYCIYFGNLIGIAFTLSLICREKFVLSNLRSPYYVIEKLEIDCLHENMSVKYAVIHKGCKMIILIEAVLTSTHNLYGEPL